MHPNLWIIIFAPHTMHTNLLKFNWGTMQRKDDAINIFLFYRHSSNQQFPPTKHGWVTGRPETMCPRRNVLGPLVPKLIVACDTMSPDWYIPVLMHFTIRLVWCKMTGRYLCRDVVFPGRFIWGTRGPRKFVRGHIVSGRPVTFHCYTVKQV